MRLFNAILIGIVQTTLVLVKREIKKVTFIEYLLCAGYCSKLYMFLLNSQSSSVR